MIAPQGRLRVALDGPSQSTEGLWPPPSFQESLPICSLPGGLFGRFWLDPYSQDPC